MIVKKVAATIVILFGLMNLISCSSPQSLIIGKWKVTGGSETMEFFRDGTLEVVNLKGETLKGKYMFIETDKASNRIKYQYGNYTTTATIIAISRYELSLDETKFHRVE